MTPEEAVGAIESMTSALREATERADAATRRAEESSALAAAATAQARAQHLALQERGVRAEEAFAVATLAAAALARDEAATVAGACRIAREALGLPEAP